MRHFFLLACLVVLSLLIEAQTSEQEWNDFNKCKQSWKYFNLKDSLTGHVLFHKKASIECGIFSSASLTLVKTSKGDTIRVLDLCNTKKDFDIGSFVTVQPQPKPGFGIDVIPFDIKTCIFKQTCFGEISKKN
jgi:hypothetical protein